MVSFSAMGKRGSVCIPFHILRGRALKGRDLGRGYLGEGRAKNKRERKNRLGREIESEGERSARYQGQ